MSNIQLVPIRIEQEFVVFIIQAEIFKILRILLLNCEYKHRVKENTIWGRDNILKLISWVWIVYFKVFKTFSQIVK